MILDAFKQLEIKKKLGQDPNLLSTIQKIKDVFNPAPVPQITKPIEFSEETKEKVRGGLNALGIAGKTLAEFPGRPIEEKLKTAGFSAPLALGAGLVGDILTPGPGEFKKLPQMTTKLLNEIKRLNKLDVPFSEIKGIVNKGGFSKPDVDLVMSEAGKLGEKVPVKTLEQNVAKHLLPLKMSPVPRNMSALERYGRGKEYVDNLKGYKEIVFESPVPTSAGEKHYAVKGYQDTDLIEQIDMGIDSDLDSAQTVANDVLSNYNLFSNAEIKKYSKRLEDLDESAINRVLETARERAVNLKRFPNYYSHVRFEELPNADLKMLETQSDLFQNRGLGREIASESSVLSKDIRSNGRIDQNKFANAIEDRKSEVAKLEPYDIDNLAHMRSFREMMKYAADTGKKRVLIPTGETAMKIEGLGETSRWSVENPAFGTGRSNASHLDLSPNELKVGKEVVNLSQGSSDKWIITDILGDGKFKAVPKQRYEQLKSLESGETPFNFGTQPSKEYIKREVDAQMMNAKETHDISGKIDTSHFVYKLNESQLPKEARKLGLSVGEPEQVGKGSYRPVFINRKKGLPVEAFGLAPIFGMPKKEDAKKSDAIQSRSAASYFGEELTKNIVSSFMPGSSIRADKPQETSKTTLGLEALGLVPFGGLAKPAIKKVGLSNAAKKLSSYASNFINHYSSDMGNLKDVVKEMTPKLESELRSKTVSLKRPIKLYRGLTGIGDDSKYQWWSRDPDAIQKVLGFGNNKKIKIISKTFLPEDIVYDSMGLSPKDFDEIYRQKLIDKLDDVDEFISDGGDLEEYISENLDVSTTGYEVMIKKSSK